MTKLNGRNIDDSTEDDRSPYVQAYRRRMKNRTERECFEDWVKTAKEYLGEDFAATLTYSAYKKRPSKGDPWFPPY